MTRVIACLGSVCLFAGLAFGQSPKFEIADVHVSAKTTNPFPRTGPVRGGRYEVKTASMVDLIRIAYGFPADKILGGPSWLEMDRFDIVAKVPVGSPPDSQQPMLQALLEERFKLVVHKDTKPLPTYALTAGKAPRLKKADGAEASGCRAQSTPGPATIRMMTNNGSGQPTELSLGPDMMIPFQCRNMTMAAFARGLRGMMGTGDSLGRNDVLDQTGLEGNWNFDVKWSMQFLGGGPMMANAGERITVFDAVDKQLGLKLEEKPVPTPVIVVDSVERKPSANPPGVEAAFPVIPVPREFEVADVKPVDPNARMGGGTRMEPGGRLSIQGMPLRFIVSRAFNTFGNDAIVGFPAWANSDRYDIVAKVSTDGPAPALDMESASPLLRALLVDRFGMKYHTEDRQVPAYALVSAKPKLKKADPASRSSCRRASATGGQALSCQNMTMADFVDQLQNTSPKLGWPPVLDATGIEGGWDFTLTFNPNAEFMMNGPGRGGDAGPGTMPQASDPSGAISIFDAVEKQLGLKLEMRKRSMPVIVIDHLDQKPTDN